MADLADLRDEDGRLEAEKVKARVDSVVAERPSWRRHVPGFDGGARTPATSRQPGLSDLLRPETRR
jgi:hypothetical protein